MNLKIFETVLSLMNDTTMTDSFQAHMTVQNATNIELICHTGVVNDSEPHSSCTCKASLLFAPLAVRVYAGSSAFPIYTKTKLFISFHIKYKTILFPKLYNIFFYILDIYNKM